MTVPASSCRTAYSSGNCLLGGICHFRPKGSSPNRNVHSVLSYLPGSRIVLSQVQNPLVREDGFHDLDGFVYGRFLYEFTTIAGMKPYIFDNYYEALLRDNNGCVFVWQQ